MIFNYFIALKFNVYLFSKHCLVQLKNFQYSIALKINFVENSTQRLPQLFVLKYIVSVLTYNFKICITSQI